MTGVVKTVMINKNSVKWRINVRILIYEYKHFGIEDIISAFSKYEYSTDKITGEIKDSGSDKEFEQKLESRLHQCEYDFVFSFNYYPVISKVCQKNGIKYVSWVYDSPLITLYNYTVINSCNYIFLFDGGMYSELKNAGIKTVYYLPLAVNTDRLDKMLINGTHAQNGNKYKCDISFVGSMYNEKKNALYDRLYKGLSEYAKGYMDALINTQYDMYGCDIMEKGINHEKIIKELQKSINVTTNPDGVESPAYSYANYFMARKVTELERGKAVRELSENYKVYVYTKEMSANVGKAVNKGPVDYYNEMPYIFHNSKINLNITLKSIKSGIPLRVFDVMGAGGFLISNYQADMLEYFNPGEDYVCYESLDELKYLVEYYLSHDKERNEIAANGYNKVKKHHSFENRVEEIIKFFK